jgi:GTP-binding protein
MKPCRFQQAHYLLSTLKEVPPFRSQNGEILPEIAFAGRSNVGKSSLLNHLLHRKHLAKVSAQPGKTYTINYFNVDDQLILVDLPGYGFAKRPDIIKDQWNVVLDHYLENRSSLALILLLMDCRRDPTPEDLALIAWAQYRKKPLLLIFTKSDTISTPEKKSLKNGILYSIKDSQSRHHLIKTINQILHGRPE